MSAPPRAGVIGWPVRHSRSPAIHGYWLRTLGLPGSYERAEVAPDALAAFVESMRRDGFVGANITLPHKEAAFGLCEDTTKTARALGAVNTLWFAGERLCGDNTDVAGFLANLDEGAPGWDRAGGTALVLGAGGAARAVVHGLVQRGFAHCTVVNRTLQRAEELGRHFGSDRTAVVAEAWDALPRLVGRADVIVNTTSLGMAGQPALGFEFGPVQPHALVTDIVYVPLETAFLAAARARGLRTVDGLGMLLHQAVPGFERWFGVRPKVTVELRRLIEADLPQAPSAAVGGR